MSRLRDPYSLLKRFEVKWRVGCSSTSTSHGFRSNHNGALIRWERIKVRSRQRIPFQERLLSILSPCGIASLALRMRATDSESVMQLIWGAWIPITIG